MKKSSSASGGTADICSQLWSSYLESASPRVRLIDGFMAFLVALGVLQFVFCLLVGTFPFNAFLGGFASTVGQFVLTAALRVQYLASEGEFPKVSPERAFGDYIFGSLILHFIVYHFIN